MDATVPYSSSITSDHLLRMEMRRVAELRVAGLSREAIAAKAKADNIFQYATLRRLKSVANVCYSRLDLLSPAAVEAIAQGVMPDTAQLCLYAFMLQHRLVWEFVITVVGEHYRIRDYSWSPREARRFMERLREQNDDVARWSPSTIVKIAQVLTKSLVDTGYLDSSRTDKLNVIWPGNVFENEVRRAGESLVFAAFNIDC